MPLTPEEIEERLIVLEERLERRLRSSKAFTTNPLALATDLDDLGSVKTHLDFEEAPLTPVDPQEDTGRLFAVDRGSATTLRYLDSDGVRSEVSHPPAVRVNEAGAQTTTNNELFTLLFGTEGFDTDNMHDLVSNTSRLTATTAGIYYIESQVQFAAHATGDRFLRMLLNGTTTISETRLRAAAGAHRQQCGMLFSLSATDYVELLVFQNSGGDLNVAPARFYMFWVAPAP